MRGWTSQPISIRRPARISNSPTSLPSAWRRVGSTGAPWSISSKRRNSPALSTASVSAKLPRRATPTLSARAAPIRPDWEDVREAVMARALRLKLQRPELCALLVEAGNRPLVEASSFDHFWGAGQDGWASTSWGAAGGDPGGAADRRRSRFLVTSHFLRIGLAFLLPIRRYSSLRRAPSCSKLSPAPQLPRGAA